MTATISPQFKPLTLGQLLDRTVFLFRRKFWTIIGLIAAIQIPISLLTLGASADTFVLLDTLVNDPLLIETEPALSSTGSAFANIVSIVGAFFLQFARAAITIVFIQLYLGEEPSIKNSIAWVKARLGRILGLVVMIIISTIGLILWFIVPCIGQLTGFGMLIYFSSVIVPLAMPVVMIENHNMQETVIRTWNLARRRFWKTFLFGFGIAYFSQGLIFGPTFLFGGSISAGIISGVTTGESSFSVTLMFVLFSIFATLISLIATPIQVGGFAIMYMDLRVQQEGVDLLLSLPQNANLPLQAPVNRLQSFPQAINEEKLITQNEFINFFGILAAFIGILVLFFGLIFGLTSLLTFLVALSV